MTVDRTAPPMPLRPYQRECLDAFHRAWAGGRRPTGKGVVTRALGVLPTGGGKTVVFSHMIKEALDKGLKVVVLVHRDELVKQTLSKVRSIAPGRRIGRVQNVFNEVDADILVVSIQTVGPDRALRRRERIKNVGLMIVDEAHHCSAVTWRASLDHWGAFGRKWNGRLQEWESCTPTPVAGFTATPSRSDDRKLFGKAGIFEEIVFKRDILDGIKGGWLVDVKAERVQVRDLNLDQVRRSGGDLQVNDLGDALQDADAGYVIAAHMKENHPHRVPAVYLPTVATTKTWTDDFRAAGFTAEYVIGDTPPDERTAIYERFRTRETQVLLSCGVLVEGWDAPWCDTVVIARPTQSETLYRQMVGRGLRPFREGGKTHALIIDVVGVSEKHALSGIADLTDEDLDVKEGESLAQAKKRKDNDIDKGLYGLEPAEPKVLTGERIVTQVELFAASDSVWLQALARGREIFFVPVGRKYQQGYAGPLATMELNGTQVSCGGGYYFLWPEKDGTFRVGRMPAGGDWGRATTVERNLTFEMAQAWAERYAVEEDPAISTKKRRWRSGAPSLKTMQKIDGLNRELTAAGMPTWEFGRDFTTAGQASDLISVAEFSRCMA